MATTTPNYGWDVPTSTDYVKDGATAIETLGDDIDASLFSITAGKNVGLVPLADVAVSAVQTLFVQNVFSANYDNYLIIWRLAAAGGSALQMRLANGTTELIGTGYSWQRLSATGTTVAGAATANTGQWDIGAVRPTTPTPNYGTLTIGNPFNATVTTYNHMTLDQLAAASIEINAGYNTSAASYSGFRWFTSTNMTGSIKIYGYRNP